MGKRKLSSRAARIPASPTVAIAARAKEMKAKGVDVISLSIGEPDFDTPEVIKEAAVRAIREGFTKYTPAAGIPELREAIAGKFSRDNGLEYSPGQIIVSSGAKEVIHHTLQALCGPRDEVIIPCPYWVSYPAQVALAGGSVAVINTGEERRFKITAGQLEKAVTPRSKILILNSPSNPTGMAYSRAELEAIAEIAVSRKLWIISDEIYEKILYDGTEHVSIASLGRAVKERTIVVNGASKTFAMTGWRIGYAAGDSDVIGAMVKMQSQTTTHPCSIAQKAAVASLTGEIPEVQVMVNEFAGRREYIVERLNALPGFSCLKPDGAFYAFPRVSDWYGKEIEGERIENSVDLARVLLEYARVAVVPGAGFGADGHLRFSYATAMDRLREGMRRLEGIFR